MGLHAFNSMRKRIKMAEELKTKKVPAKKEELKETTPGNIAPKPKTPRKKKEE